MSSLEEMVEEDSFARIIDLFVDALPLDDLGFKHSSLNRQGNEPYHPSDLLKLLINGQRNGIRSANKLHVATKINLEMIRLRRASDGQVWLLKGLQPSARTICYFRSNNNTAIKKAHRHFVKKLKKWHLIDGTILALDSTKVRGQNSLKNNFNQKKIDRHLEYLENRIEEYLDQLDDVEDKPRRQKKRNEVLDKIQQAEQRIDHYKVLQDQVNQSTDGQISTTDPDARAVIKHRNIVEVGYNIQTTVDAKHHMIVDTFAGGVTDRGDLGRAAKRSQDLLKEDKIDLLADKGYHNGADIAYCERKGIRTWIPPSRKHHQKPVGFRKTDFAYDAASDIYICPDGQTMEVELLFKKRNNRRNYRVKRYSTPMCTGCPLRKQCTTSPLGRKIERPNHQPHVERNDARVQRYPDFYRMRQQIVEPIFGVWKRQWHFDHLILKRRENIEAEVSLAALTYNLMRLLAVRGTQWVKTKLEASVFFQLHILIYHKMSQMVNRILKIMTTRSLIYLYTILNCALRHVVA